MSFDPTKYTKGKFVKGSDLPRGRAVVVTISRVYEYTFDQTGEIKPALDFADFDQSMVLNKTQVSTLIEMFGQDIRLWVGQSVSLLPVPSGYQGKPTILIGEANGRAPTVNGQQPQQPSGDGPQQPPQWATQGPDSADIPF